MKEASDPAVTPPVALAPKAHASPQARAMAHGIDRHMIAAVVGDFYAACRCDPTVGPIFNARINDWNEHLAKIQGFWAAALLRTGEYSGRPLAAHLAIPNLESRHFSVWARLFREAVQRHCPPEAEAAFMEVTGMMARHMTAVIENRRRQ